MKTICRITTLFILLTIPFIFPVISPAPGTTGWMPSYTTQAGCSPDLQKEIQKEGDISEDDSFRAIATVTDPERLANFGLSAQKNDKLEISAVGGNAFKLLNVRTGKSVLVVPEKNRLKLLKN